MPSEYKEDALDSKLNAAFDGKVVRKDLLHRIKTGTNVPTFVLEFPLARYCASNDPAEIQAGLEAVLSTLQENYVRPDEANAAQSRVAMKGKHKFIDKVHVRYVEKEKRHWASLKNFNSQRIAVGEKFYRDNDRLLEGGIWAPTMMSMPTLMHFMSRICDQSSSAGSISLLMARPRRLSAATNGSMSCFVPSAWSRRS